MRKLLVILLLFVPLSLFGVKWHVATNGSDVTGNGSEANPWASIYWAGRQVSGAAYYGDTIFIHNGEYVETEGNTGTIWGVRVNVLGESKEGVILKSTSTSSLFYYIHFYNSGEGIQEGRQFVKNLTFESDQTTIQRAINIENRSYITIEDCNFIGIKYQAIRINATFPNYADSINIRRCYFYDASGTTDPIRGWASTGAITFNGVDNSEWCYNTIISPYAENNSSIRGMPMHASGSYHNRRIKFHHNRVEQFARRYEKAFSIEWIGGRGGIEIYDNVFHSAVDINRFTYDESIPGCEFGLKMYRNLFYADDNKNYSWPGSTMEAWARRIFIYQNHFKNTRSCIGIAISQAGDSVQGFTRSKAEDIYIFNNVFENIGGLPVLCMAAAATDVITVESHDFVNGDRIGFTGETLPGGISRNSIYYVRDATATTFSLSTLSTGANLVDITSDGTMYGTLAVDGGLFGISSGAQTCIFDDAANRILVKAETSFFLAGEGQEVVFTSTRPAEINAGQVYYMRNPRIRARDFQISTTPGGEIINFSASGDGTYRLPIDFNNINYFNNTVISRPYSKTRSALKIGAHGDIDNVNFQNNIISGLWYTPIWIVEPYATIDNLNISYNIFDKIENGYTPWFQSINAGDVGMYFDNNILATDPLLMDIVGGDYRLREGSPAIDAGINVGLSSDYRGWPLVGLPDIGAYEFGASPPAGRFYKDESGVLLRSVEGTLMKVE
ncbi:MAG: choice-of-anchor Q domain-containing protein [Desulfomonilia bacterium]